MLAGVSRAPGTGMVETVRRRTPMPTGPRRRGSRPCTEATTTSGVSQMTDTSKLINQLRALVLLTQTEEQVARTRVSQARTDAVRRELTQNADNAAERTRVITDQLRALRSEEHTSELQSRQYLVCRLLLEKKNNMLHKK